MTTDAGQPHVLLIEPVGDGSPLALRLRAILAAVGLGVRTAPDPADVVNQLPPARSPLPAAVLVGPSCPHPVAVARQAHGLAPTLHAIFLASGETAVRLRRELSLAPMIGPLWTVVAPDDPAMPRIVADAAASGRQRRQFRTTLDRMNLQLSARPPVDSAEYRKLVASDRYLANVLRHAHDAVVSLDAAGRVVSWNEGAERLFGVPSASALGRRVAEVAAWPQELGTLLGRATEGEPVIDHAVRCPLGGEPRDVEVTLTPVRDDGRHVMGVAAIIRDVTERARQAEALRASEERLRAVFEQSTAGIAQLDADGRFVLVNQWMCDLLGYTRDELLGLRMQDVTHPDDLPRNLDLLEKAKGAGGTYDIEKRYVRKDRTPVWVHVSTSVLRNGDGTPRSVLGVVTDVTARRLAEEETRRAKAEAEQGVARWRAVVEGMTEGLVLADAEGGLLTMNPAALAAHEFASVGEMLKRVGDYPDLFELHDPAGRFLTPDEWPIARVLRGERFAGYEVRVHRRDTGKVWFGSYGGTPVTDADGRVTLAVLTLRDVTAQRTAEAAVRESEARFRQLAETIPQLAWTARPDGHIVWYNRRWYEYTGTTPQQMEGWGWQDVHDPAVLPSVLQRWRASIATGEPFEMEFPLKGADGSFRWFLTRVAPLRDADGGILLWFGSNTDIEDRRRVAEERARLLDAERAARADAERASRMKDEFLATLSHELRTPLNAILGWSQILRTGKATDAGDLAQGLETIERNARAQTKIIEDLLEMSRVISGKIRLDVQRVHLASVVEAAVQTVRHAADAKGVRLQVVLDPLAGPVAGDPARLQQVFWNLLSNSVRYGRRGGRVRVLLGRVNSHLEVSVTDDGEGISPEFLPHVFDRFRQADNSTTRRHGGLGLGLSIVKQLVELHGGTVRAKSPGGGLGATFTVALPLMSVHPEPEPTAGPERRHPRADAGASAGPVEHAGVKLSGVRVLVVDDEPDARNLVKRLLEDCEAIVTTAGSVAEALEAVRKDKFDALVSDIGMPERDGFDLIQKVRALPPAEGGDLAAVALTAYARSEDRTRAMLAGFHGHVAKPVEPAELVATIAGLARRSGAGRRPS